jgi:hypothetical protein
MDRIYVSGSGFTGATGVQIGDAWGGDPVGDGDVVITVSVPDLAPGSYWVVVHGADGEQSACDGPNQTLEILAGGDGEGALAPQLWGITPEEIVVGEANTYWLSGEGLTNVMGVRCGAHACAFEGCDDASLKIDISADLGVTAGEDVKIEVLGPGGAKVTVLEAAG